MSSITKVAEEMQRILKEVAEEKGRTSGFIKREVKINGASFAQTLIFGWMSKPQATYEELAQAATTLGIELTAQALEQRFNQEAATFLKELLDETIKTIIRSDKAAIPILERFNGTYMEDSSTITLPDELKSIWQGCGEVVKKGHHQP
ncbi:MAG: transposase IS4 family protein [bacterium]|nr:MAG: transposase IS4 family protein [bacterium]